MLCCVLCGRQKKRRANDGWQDAVVYAVHNVERWIERERESGAVVDDMREMARILHYPLSFSSTFCILHCTYTDDWRMGNGGWRVKTRVSEGKSE